MLHSAQAFCLRRQKTAVSTSLGRKSQGFLLPLAYLMIISVCVQPSSSSFSEGRSSCSSGRSAQVHKCVSRYSENVTNCSKLGPAPGGPCVPTAAKGMQLRLAEGMATNMHHLQAPGEFLSQGNEEGRRFSRMHNRAPSSRPPRHLKGSGMAIC